MTKFKKGDKVMIINGGHHEGVISKIIDDERPSDKYPYMLVDSDVPLCSNFWGDHELKLVSKNLDTLEVDDFIVSNSGNKAKVLAICGKLIGITYTYDVNTFNCWEIIDNLKKDGWTIFNEQPEQIEELTVEQICKELGREIKIVK